MITCKNNFPFCERESGIKKNFKATLLSSGAILLPSIFSCFPSLFAFMGKNKQSIPSREITRQKTAYGKISTDEWVSEFSRQKFSLKLLQIKKVFKGAEKYHHFLSCEAAAVKCKESDNKSQECLENHCQHPHKKVREKKSERECMKEVKKAEQIRRGGGKCSHLKWVVFMH